jgi:glycosyltransferase involved in cell wall biosynthesis
MTSQRVGIVSHSVPPFVSGQAIVIGRLLSTLPADRVVLISREQPPSPTGGYRRHRLPPLLRLPAPTTSFVFAPNWTANALWGIWRRSRQIEEIVRRESIGLLVGCSGDLYDLPATRWAAARARVPFIAYVFDDYRYQWTGVNRAIAAALEPAIVRGAAAIIVPNEHLDAEYRARHGRSCVVVHNPCLMPTDEERRRTPSTHKRIVYTGSIYHAHHDAFRNLVRAIDRLGRRDLRLVLYTAQPQAELAANGIAGWMVEHHGPVDEAAARRAACGADALFLPLAFNSPVPEVIRTSSPGKLGDYLATGRPILAHAPRGSFVSDFLTQRRCGVVVDEDDAGALGRALAHLLDDVEHAERLGVAARVVAEQEFALQPTVERFRAVLAANGLSSV